jgi:NAD(P)H-hydrate epimerase
VPVIDGLLGSGLSRPVTGTFRQIITDINTLPNPVYAVDIPSGLPGQENIPPDAAIVCAQKTYTFQFPKLNFFFEDNYMYVGEWEVLDIGMGCGDYSCIKPPFRTVDASFIDTIYTTKRNPFAHKNTFGHALLIAGSKAKWKLRFCLPRPVCVQVPDCLRRISRPGAKCRFILRCRKLCSPWITTGIA